MSKWIKFEQVLEERKTKTWIVRTIEGSAALGVVRWHSPWRRYAFFPVPETLYENQCLNDLATFLEDRTREQRETWKKRA
jgi:hypothetical protein